MTPDEHALGELLADAGSIVAFTGAGVSTESGLPDFRSPGGLWSRYNPADLTFARYVASAETRAQAWQLRRELEALAPEPNPAHHALAKLETAGRLRGVVTQNIDGLHQAAGCHEVVELHGTSREVMCIGARPRAGTPDGCGFRAPSQWALDRIDGGEPDPACPDCGGLIKAATVSFGQNLAAATIERAEQLVRAADLVLAVGSSLQVYPAADVPAAGARAGARLAVVNAEPTPLDPLADLAITASAGAVLPPAVGVALTR